MAVTDDRWNEFHGNTKLPEDFTKFWNTLCRQDCQLPAAFELKKRMTTAAAEYDDLSYMGLDGRTITTSYIRPLLQKPTAIVIDFHNTGRSSRGQFYLNRYTALGFSVMAPPCHPGITLGFSMSAGEEIQNQAACMAYREAFLAVRIARELEPLLPVYTYGEGLGAALAVACSGRAGVEKCAAQNPLLTDYRTVYELGYDTGYYETIRRYFRDIDGEHSHEEEFFGRLDYVDCLNFARFSKASLLLGTGLLDEVSPAKGQYGLFHSAAGEKRHSVFPKHGHERINFFENDAMEFFLER